MSPELERELRRGRAEDGALRATAAAANGFEGSLAARAMLADAQLALPDDMLHYFDRGSMAHSLEVRVPFLDHPLVEFCATIPTNLKISRRLTTKYLLKHAAERLLPREIIHRKKVGFFNPVVAAWFECQADGAVRDYLLAPDLVAGAHVDPARVRRLVESHLAHPTRTTGDAILTLLMLEVWLRSYTRLVRERASVSDTSLRVA
jgi:asparagine synthase (glutamine-hydrolysing)